MSTTSISHRQIAIAFLAAMLLGVVIVVSRLLGADGPLQLFADTDDAMRMVVVRDLLAGQGWQDVVQTRLNSPFGAEIHWSRLVDLPIAGLVVLGDAVVPGQGAAFAGLAWPLILLAALLAVSLGLTLRLVGPEGALPALLLPLFSPAVTAEFAAGRLDHHNIQVILTLAIAWASIEALARPRIALVSGLLAATALAIGTEALPAISAAILGTGIAWIASPIQARQLRWFGLGVFAGTAVHLALAMPPERWFEPACDAISLVYLVATGLAAIAFLGLSLLRIHRLWLRAAIGVGTGFVCLLVLFWLFPQCAGGPYGELDPWLRQNWMHAVSEAKPFWRSLPDLPAYTIAVGIPPILGLAIIGWRLRTVETDRAAWAMLGLFVLVMALVMLIQVRGARLSTMPAIPAAAWAIAAARARFSARPSLAAGAALLAGWLAFAGILVVLIVTVVMRLASGGSETASASGDRRACILPSAFADLAQIPPERIMTPIDLGAHMLLETPHEVVAAPYHRNEAGMLDAFAFFNQPIERARAIADERSLGLVVVCPDLPEMRGLDPDPRSFISLRQAGDLPQWLAPVPGPGPLEVYAILPAR
jgi:hypothetical protein